MKIMTRDNVSYKDAVHLFAVESGKVTKVLKSELHYWEKSDRVATKDGSDMFWYGATAGLKDLYAHEENANKEALVYWNTRLALLETGREEAKNNIAKFEQALLPYLKKLSDKKPIGKMGKL